VNQNQAKKDFRCRKCCGTSYSPVYGSGIGGLLDWKLLSIMRILFKKDDVGGGYKCNGCQTKFKDPEKFSVKPA
jgi:hypothetical protein